MESGGDGTACGEGVEDINVFGTGREWIYEEETGGIRERMNTYACYCGSSARVMVGYRTNPAVSHDQ